MPDNNARWGVVSAWNLADVSDAIGSNTLTNVGGATFSAGKVGGAVTCDKATPRYLGVSLASPNTHADELWFACWFKYTAAGANYALFAGFGRLFESDGGGSPIIGLYANGFAHMLDSGLVAPPANTWHFAMCYYAGGTNYLSVNGGAFVSGTADTPFSTGVVTIGERGDGGGGFDGQIDAAVFGKNPPLGMAALADEIRDYLYNAGAGKEPPYSVAFTPPVEHYLKHVAGF